MAKKEAGEHEGLIQSVGQGVEGIQYRDPVGSEFSHFGETYPDGIESAMDTIVPDVYYLVADSVVETGQLSGEEAYQEPQPAISPRRMLGRMFQRVAEHFSEEEPVGISQQERPSLSFQKETQEKEPDCSDIIANALFAASNGYIEGKHTIYERYVFDKKAYRIPMTEDEKGRLQAKGYFGIEVFPTNREGKRVPFRVSYMGGNYRKKREIRPSDDLILAGDTRLPLVPMGIIVDEEMAMQPQGNSPARDMEYAVRIGGLLTGETVTQSMYRSAEGIKRFLDKHDLSSVSVVNVVLFALSNLGYDIPQSLIQQAQERGAISIGDVYPNVMIVPYNGKMYWVEKPQNGFTETDIDTLLRIVASAANNEAFQKIKENALQLKINWLTKKTAYVTCFDEAIKLKY